MMFFKKKELLWVSVIFLFLFLASYKGYVDAKKRERDITRMLDFGNTVKAIEAYKRDFDIYPLSDDDGRLIACIGEDTDYLRDKNGNFVVSSAGKRIRSGLEPCEWGKDPLMEDMYLEILPKDTQSSAGVKYIYVSDGENFQLFGSYETKEMPDYSDSVKANNRGCGTRICNFGRASQNITLDNFIK
jgi:hypothetical protein